MRRFATILTLLACLTIITGCGGDEETSENPVDNNVPTDDITPGEKTDGPPAHLLGGGDDNSDESSGDGNSDADENADDDDSDAADTANNSNNEGLVQPDLNAPPTTGPTLEQPKLRDPTKSGNDN